MKLAYLVRGLPGHPLHPPLTDVTVGAYTFATVSDAGSWVFVDSQLVLDNGAARAPTTKSGSTIRLSRGTHPLFVKV